jgi:hypothetical protein
MQSAKDSFYVALRERLAALNPERTVLLAGVRRPAVMVAENEVGTPAPREAFQVTWRGAATLPASGGAERPLVRLDVMIEYRTAGSADALGTDRGRRLAALDVELAQMLAPRSTPKRDHAQEPAAELGSMVLWSDPEFLPVEASESELRRSVRATVFFRPEAAWS